MTKKERLEAIVFFYAKGNSSRFGTELLGKSRNYVSQCVTSDRLDYELLAETFPSLSAEWLLRGEGEMIKSAEPPKNEINIDASDSQSITGSNNIQVKGDAGALVADLKSQNDELRKEKEELYKQLEAMRKMIDKLLA